LKRPSRRRNCGINKLDDVDDVMVGASAQRLRRRSKQA
jgi:hypothetical protein